MHLEVTMCVQRSIKTKLNAVVCISVLLACYTSCTWAQSTNGLGKGGCSFLDDQNVYNIELMKGTHQAPCPSLNSLNDDFKQTEDKISETAYELSRIQTRIVDLLDLNNELTAQVHNVQAELRATLYSLKSGEVGWCRFLLTSLYKCLNNNNNAINIQFKSRNAKVMLY